MAELTLTLEKAMAISSNKDLQPEIQVLGHLAAAGLLIKKHGDDFDPDVWSVLVNLSEMVADSLAVAGANG